MGNMNKKILIIILVLVLSLALTACGGKKSDSDSDIDFDENILISYIDAFKFGEFDRLADMVGELSKAGDIYYISSEQPPKTLEEIIGSQWNFVTHFFGEDAWSHVAYSLQEFKRQDVTQVRVDFIFNNKPKHILGYENIHVVFTDEGGDWAIKEGLTWENNQYSDYPRPDYYRASEAVFAENVNHGTKPDELIKYLGEPVEYFENEDPFVHEITMSYDYGLFTFGQFYDSAGEIGEDYYLTSIRIFGGDKPVTRGITIGDGFEDVMIKFPLDKDWTTDPYNCFYGNNTYDSFGGAVFSYDDDYNNIFDTVVLVPDEYVPYMQLEFINEVLAGINFVFIEMY